MSSVLFKPWTLSGRVQEEHFGGTFGGHGGVRRLHARSHLLTNRLEQKVHEELVARRRQILTLLEDLQGGEEEKQSA